jgi:DNA-binding transcriptional regulator YdaS (Cro superfamily)
MTAPPWIYVYDERDDDVYSSTQQLRERGLIDWPEMRTFTRRVELFQVIAERDPSDGPAVALVDLEAEPRDPSYSGHRVIETIRRHPTLRSRCRPLAYTAHARPDVVDLACEHLAITVVSKTGLDRAEVDPEDVRRFLMAVRDDQYLTENERDDAPRVFPTPLERPARDYGTEAQLTRALARVLSVPPENCRVAKEPYFWTMMRYLAYGLEPASVAQFIETDRQGKARSVRNALERLAKEVEFEYIHGDKVDWTRFAGDLLGMVPQFRGVPTPVETLRLLVRVNRIEPLLTDKRLRQLSYVDPEALAALDRVLDARAIPPRQGNTGRWKLVEQMTHALEALEPALADRARLQAAFTRGVHGIYETYRETRRAGVDELA